MMTAMRTIITLLTLVAVGSAYGYQPSVSARADGFTPSDSPSDSTSALLLVYFGTTNDSARQQTLDAFTAYARQQQPTRTVAEAYTSPRVIASLAKRGIDKLTPVDALLQLRSQQCRRVSIVPTFVIDGNETQRLKADVELLRPFFDTIAVTPPLLNSIDDCERLCHMLAQRHPAEQRQHEHVVFVGHGTQGPATALYSQLDYILHHDGYTNHHVATIEGYPTFETLLSELKQQRARTVTLVPLLFVAGGHAATDIARDWRQYLERNGFRVNLRLEGLGQVPEVRQMILEREKGKE